MALTQHQRNLLDGMCPVANKIGLVDLVDRVAGTLTITANNGVGTIAVPSDWGTNYLVVGLVVRSGPAGIVEARATQKAAGSCTVTVVDSSGSGVDCSSTSAVLDYLIIRSV